MSEPRIDGSKPVRAGEELDVAKLDAYLEATLPDVSGDLAIEQFPSGYSNLTYLLRKGDAELVLRRPPFKVQVKSGHDMGREYRVLSALAPVYPPAPRPLAFCEDEAVIGAPFYVMERRRGVIVRRPPLPPGFAGNPDRFRQMCEGLIDSLADLHAIDYEAAGLGDLGRPQGYARRQVEGWIARFGKAKTSDVPDMETVAAWLMERIPASGDTTLVHNDFKFDNVMLDPADPTRIVAVLDWEMCTLGDPLMDLGTTLGYWIVKGEEIGMAFAPSTEPGAPSRHELAQRYAARTGRDISNMLFYYAFALLKIGVIIQQIYYRYHKGYTKDARFAHLDKVVAALARQAVRSIEAGSY